MTSIYLEVSCQGTVANEMTSLLPLAVFLFSLQFSAVYGVLGWLFSSKKVDVPSHVTLIKTLGNYCKENTIKNSQLFRTAQHAYFEQFDIALDKILSVDFKKAANYYSSLQIGLKTVERHTQECRNDAFGYMEDLLADSEAAKEKVRARLNALTQNAVRPRLPDVVDFKSITTYFGAAGAAAASSLPIFQQQMTIFQVLWFNQCDFDKIESDLKQYPISADTMHALEEMITRLEREYEGPLNTATRVFFALKLLGVPTNLTKPMKDANEPIALYNKEMLKAIEALKILHRLAQVIETPSVKEEANEPAPVEALSPSFEIPVSVDARSRSVTKRKRSKKNEGQGSTKKRSVKRNSIVEESFLEESGIAKKNRSSVTSHQRPKKKLRNETGSLNSPADSKKHTKRKPTPVSLSLKLEQAHKRTKSTKTAVPTVQTPSEKKSRKHTPDSKGKRVSFSVTPLVESGKASKEPKTSKKPLPEKSRKRTVNRDQGTVVRVRRSSKAQKPSQKHPSMLPKTIAMEASSAAPLETPENSN